MGRIIGLTFPASTAGEASGTFICPHCGKTYKSREALDKHIGSKHPGESENE